MIGVLPDYRPGAVLIGVAGFHGILLPRIAILQREELVCLEPLEMAHDSRFADQASH
jgi:hypothetical protein